MPAVLPDDQHTQAPGRAIAEPALDAGANHELRLPILPPRLAGGLVLTVRVLAAAYLILGVSLLLVAARLSRSWWWQDDLKLLAGAARRSLSPGLLLSSYNGHLVPGTWVMAWVFDRIAPLQWWPAALVSIALVAAVDLSMLALLRRIFGTRPAILVPFAMVCATSLTLTSTLWWAASMQWLPVTLSLSLGLWCHIGFWETGRLRDAAGALGCVVLGLAFFEKALTTVLVLALFSVLYGVPGPFWQRPWKAFSAHAGYWLTHAAVAGGFLGLYLARVHIDTGPAPTSFAVWRTIRWMLLDTLLPSLIGGPLRWYTTPATTISAWPHPPPFVAIAAWILTAAAIIGSLVTRRDAWRAWVLLAMFLAISVFLVVRARVGLIGPFIGRDHRYLTDVAVLAPLCLALAWLPARPEVDVAGQEDAATHSIRQTGVLARRFVPNPQAVSLAGAMAVLLMTIGGAVSGERFMANWTRNPAKPYLQNLQDGIDDAHDADRATTLNLMPEAVVPDLVMVPTFEQHRRLSHVTLPMRTRPNFPAFAASYSVVDAQGRVHPADVAGMSAAGIQGKNCAKAGQNAAVTFGLPQQAWRWTVKLEYLAQTDTSARLSLGPFPAVPIRLQKGLNRVYVDLLGGASSQLVLNGVDPGSSVCMGRATIGTLTATG